MPNYHTADDLDVVLEGANNIQSVLWNTEVWVVSYKNDLSPDRFDTCQEMMDFLVNEGND